MHVLADVAIGHVTEFLEVFSSDGLQKRREHGCVASTVFVPQAAGRVVVLLEFGSAAEFESFRDDPEAPPIMRRGGAQGPPTFTLLERVETFPG